MEILVIIGIVIGSILILATLFGFILIAVGLNAYFRTEEGTERLKSKSRSRD